MATASAALSENLKCPICQELFTEPKILQCSHSFCKKCLVEQHRIQASGDIIKCGVCRIPSNLPGSDVDQLPNNQTVKAIVDFHKERQAGLKRQTSSASSEASTSGYDTVYADDDDSIPTMCSVCVDECSVLAFAEVYCQMCSQYMCASCLAQHSRFAGNAKHEVVSASDIHRGDVRVQRTCLQHPEEQERYVCMSCMKCTCFKCRMLQHDSKEGHDVFDIAEYEESQKIATTMLRVKAHDKIGEIQDYIDFVNQQGDNVKQAVSKVKKSITDEYDAVVAKLSRERDERLRECLRKEQDLCQKLSDMAESKRRKIGVILEKIGAVGNSLDAFMREQTLLDESLAGDLEKILDDEQLDHAGPVEVYSHATSFCFRPLDETQREKEIRLGNLHLGSSS